MRHPLSLCVFGLIAACSFTPNGASGTIDAPPSCPPPPSLKSAPPPPPPPLAAMVPSSTTCGACR